VGSGDIHDEHVVDGPRAKGSKGPKDRGPLRGVRRIGSHIYVVGMDRQAYRREGPKHWQSVGPPSWRQRGRQPPGAADVKGFEAVDGFSESDIYAVGWDGEIWNYDDRKWQPLPSPAKEVLVDVCCAGDGMVYACGREGLLVRGRARSWEVIKLRGMTQDIWSLAWFNGRLYLSTMSRVFTLEGKALAAVGFGSDTPKTCHRLSVGDGVLWSIGAKDVFTFDGTKWTRID
jgi:cellulase/cellobiase CelA1